MGLHTPTPKQHVRKPKAQTTSAVALDGRVASRESFIDHDLMIPPEASATLKVSCCGERWRPAFWICFLTTYLARPVLQYSLDHILKQTQAIGYSKATETTNLKKTGHLVCELGLVQTVMKVGEDANTSFYQFPDPCSSMWMVLQVWHHRTGMPQREPNSHNKPVQGWSPLFGPSWPAHLRSGARQDMTIICVLGPASRRGTLACKCHFLTERNKFQLSALHYESRLRICVLCFLVGICAGGCFQAFQAVERQ